MVEQGPPFLQPKVFIGIRFPTPLFPVVEQHLGSVKNIAAMRKECSKSESSDPSSSCKASHFPQTNDFHYE